jgi:predicted ATP-dependent endonuclease of OLD family
MRSFMRPLAFRILDYKSIKDSGICNLSEDRITALAGQNEAGKTSILTALRDFDLDDGADTVTPDYLPDQNAESANPFIGVKFAVDAGELDRILGSQEIPPEAKAELVKNEFVWVWRSPKAKLFTLDVQLTKLWPTAKASSDLKSSDAPTDETPIAEPTYISFRKFAALIRNHSPHFTYFDTFKDELPREISIQAIVTAASDQLRDVAFKALPLTVRDFLTLAKVDMNHISTIAGDDRILGNYLKEKAANISGHFLDYWKQRNNEETVTLRTQHNRKANGELFLSFYVHDGVDQYPDQRSRGFLWFLSFFLRLTSAEVEARDIPSLILIDEPGTYLHSKAQKDVLALMENWIVKTHWVLYSTHSPYLLPASDLHRVKVVVKQGGKGTFIADRLTDPRIKSSGFSDALSPVLTSIGIDLNESFNLIRKKNILVEGISDYYYLHAWDKLLELNTLNETSVFPGTSASTVPTLASLLIGWGTQFCALLDRDGPGNNAAKKLREDMSVNKDCIIQMEGGVAIEDLFSGEISLSCSRIMMTASPRTPLQPQRRL